MVAVPTSVREKQQIALQLLGKQGSFPAYFVLYDDLVQRQNDFVVPIGQPGQELPSKQQVISTEAEVLIAAEILKESAKATKEETCQALRRSLDARQPGSDRDVDNILSLAFHAMFMVDPAATAWHSSDFVLAGYRPTSWLPHETLVDFVERTFPVVSPSSEWSEKARSAIDMRASMKAWKLQKKLGLRFRLTNNLAEHLLLDSRRNCLYLFHHAAFLKAHLERHQSLSIGTVESLESGSLPPQLLVETLHSLQAVIFPSIDPDSADILDELIEKHGFDPDNAQYEGYKLFREPPEGFRYLYWGERIAKLHDVLLRRPPRNKLGRWFQRRGTEGNALFIALVALLISIIVGLISIGLSCVQVWIAWMAWKYPAPPPSSI